MKVLITGGCGFVGTNLALHFAHAEPETEVALFDTATPQVELHRTHSFVFGDIRDLAGLLEACRGVEEVYHLAGVLGTSELLRSPRLASDINVAGTATVLDACRLAGVARVYVASKPHFASYHENAYSLTKHAAELLALMYRDQYGMEVATTRWLNAVGPYQRLYPVRKLVPVSLLFALHDCDLEVYGSGRQTIDPIDTRDLCRLTVHACRHLGRQKNVVEMGSGKGVTCNEAAETVLRVVREAGIPTRSRILHLPMREGEVGEVHLKADMSYWTGAGLMPQFTLEESVRAALEHTLTLPEAHRRNALRFYGKDPCRETTASC